MIMLRRFNVNVIRTILPICYYFCETACMCEKDVTYLFARFCH